MTSNFPRTETYELVPQMRRAATSVACNIAEGQGRGSARDQVRFYYMARGSLLELETQLLISVDLAYIDGRTGEDLVGATAEVGRLLNGLIRKTLKTTDKIPTTDD